MTAEEQFKAWYSTTSIPSDHVESAREAYLAATKATAARCVEICGDHSGLRSMGIAAVIRKEFNLE